MPSIAMQFKTFVWPNNPEKLQMTFHRNTKVTPSGGQWTVTDIARMGRVISGEGVFYGQNAYQSFSSLAQLFYNNSPGTLILPNWSSIQVLMTDLACFEEPSENFLRYSFSFLEVPSP